MRGPLPSVWFLGATLYCASLLSLIQPFSGDEAWPAPPPANETVRAKQPLSFAPKSEPEGPAPTEQAAAPVTEPKTSLRNEWVQIADYTTVVRSRPGGASPALFASSVGRPFRVIAREAGFVRVQDLGSGQLGWVKETSLAPFVGGYRQREQRVVEPQVAVAEPQATVAKSAIAAGLTPVAAKRVPQPRNHAVAAQPQKDTVAATESAPRGLFGRKRNQVQHVALGSQGTGVATIMQRAFGRF